MTAGNRMTDSPPRDQDSDQGPEDLRSDIKKKKGSGRGLYIYISIIPAKYKSLTFFIMGFVVI